MKIWKYSVYLQLLSNGYEHDAGREVDGAIYGVILIN